MQHTGLGGMALLLLQELGPNKHMFTGYKYSVQYIEDPRM